jgi:hypothetical protein
VYILVCFCISPKFGEGHIAPPVLLLEGTNHAGIVPRPGEKSNLAEDGEGASEARPWGSLGNTTL